MLTASKYTLHDSHRPLLHHPARHARGLRPTCVLRSRDRPGAPAAGGARNPTHSEKPCEAGPRSELELTLPASTPSTPSVPLPPALRHISVSGEFDSRDGTGEILGNDRFRRRGECWSPRFSAFRDRGNSAATRVRATLYDAAGRALDDRELAAGAEHDEVTRFMFSGCVADHPDARRLVVRRGAVVFLDARASPHPPVLRVLFPTPETRFVDRNRPDVLHWTVSDEDAAHYLGEAMPYAIRRALSFDGELWGDEGGAGNVDFEALVDVKEPADRFGFPCGDFLRGPCHGRQHVWLEIEVSDGFWSSIVVVGPFRVRDCDVPPGFPPTDDACGGDCGTTSR